MVLSFLSAGPENIQRSLRRDEEGSRQQCQTGKQKLHVSSVLITSGLLKVPSVVAGYRLGAGEIFKDMKTTAAGFHQGSKQHNSILKS